MDRLTNEIKQFFEDCKETEESKERTNEVRRRVKVIVNEKNPGADVLIVGSCGNGFGTRNSDVDLTINVPGSFLNSIGTDLLFTIQRRLLRDKASYTDVVAVTAAKVPIVTFNYCCGLETLACDVSVNRKNNIFNSVLLKAYSMLDGRVKPLVLALKKWGKASSVIDSKNNRLASFTLSLMVIHYLQSACSPPVLPCLQNLYPGFFTPQNVEQLSRYINDPLPQHILSFSSRNTETIGGLFVGFFDHYYRFNWTRDGISVRDGTNIRRPLKRGSNNTCLYVEDPYERHSNTARGVFKEWIWSDIVAAFRTAKTSLRNGRSFNDII